MPVYFRGDVILASIPLGEHTSAKIRPGVVVAEEGGRVLQVCPVTSREPVETPYIALELHDFIEGGLDLFEESYVLLSHVRAVRSRDVIAKKGRLTDESIDAVLQGERTGGRAYTG